ncbi:unnamed protein product, partial [Amoebophrya sp. A120]|eukprot:GSA120T00012731001.1
MGATTIRRLRAQGPPSWRTCTNSSFRVPGRATIWAADDISFFRRYNCAVAPTSRPRSARRTITTGTFFRIKIDSRCSSVFRCSVRLTISVSCRRSWTPSRGNRVCSAMAESSRRASAVPWRSAAPARASRWYIQAFGKCTRPGSKRLRGASWCGTYCRPQPMQSFPVIETAPSGPDLTRARRIRRTGSGVCGTRCTRTMSRPQTSFGKTHLGYGYCNSVDRVHVVVRLLLLIAADEIEK